MDDYTPYKRRKGVCNSYCNGCIYLGYATGDMKLCEYMLRTDKRRPCPAGTGCTVKQKGERKTRWELEKEEGWKVRMQREKKTAPVKEVFRRVCPVCGKSFITTDGKKIYCCDDCRYRNKAAKAAEKRKVFHRFCKECGTEFDTTNGRKVFCCRECAFKYKQRERYRKGKGNGEEE